MIQITGQLVSLMYVSTIKAVQRSNTRSVKILLMVMTPQSLAIKQQASPSQTQSDHRILLHQRQAILQISIPTLE